MHKYFELSEYFIKLDQITKSSITLKYFLDE